jgi:hypothetical protein
VDRAVQTAHDPDWIGAQTATKALLKAAAAAKLLTG